MKSVIPGDVGLFLRMINCYKQTLHKRPVYSYTNDLEGVVRTNHVIHPSCSPTSEEKEVTKTPVTPLTGWGKYACEGSPTRLVKYADSSSNTMDPWGPVVQAIESHSTLCQVGETQHFVENMCLRALRSGHWAS